MFIILYVYYILSLKLLNSHLHKLSEYILRKSEKLIGLVKVDYIKRHSQRILFFWR